MIDEEMVNALNKQLNAELYSGYLYLSMATYFESIDLPGFASWNKDHAHEEFTHAMKFYDYLVSRGEQVILGEIEALQQSGKVLLQFMITFSSMNSWLQV